MIPQGVRGGERFWAVGAYVGFYVKVTHLIVSFPAVEARERDGGGAQGAFEVGGVDTWVDCCVLSIFSRRG